jgi:L-threonylcarbamoyladenylate synthase
MGLTKILEGDGVIAFVTDTVWGLGCLPESEKAVKRIYEIKGRDEQKPLILMSHDIYPLLKYLEPLPKQAHILIKQYFPGALTLVVPKKGGGTVGIRVPDNETFSQLCLQVPGGVLATTSANISGEPPAMSYEEAAKLGADITLPDNGCCASGIASTVAAVIGDEVQILRQGSVTLYFPVPR